MSALDADVCCCFAVIVIMIMLLMLPVTERSIHTVTLMLVRDRSVGV